MMGKLYLASLVGASNSDSKNERGKIPPWILTAVPATGSQRATNEQLRWPAEPFFSVLLICIYYFVY